MVQNVLTQKDPNKLSWHPESLKWWTSQSPPLFIPLFAISWNNCCHWTLKCHCKQWWILEACRRPDDIVWPISEKRHKCHKSKQGLLTERKFHLESSAWQFWRYTIHKILIMVYVCNLLKHNYHSTAIH